MKAIRATKHGKISEVTELYEADLPEMKNDEVSLDLVAAPINPSDVMSIKGLYPKKIVFPAIIGNEGLGRVVTLGSEVSTVKVGDLVLLPAGSGTWRSSMITDSRSLFPLPEADVYQLSMLTVNPPTAYLMLKKFVDLGEGDWVIQNAANSAVGRYIIQLSKIMGYKTVNIVRRKSLVSELKEIGADVVLVDGDDVAKRVKSATNNELIKLGIDAVSGDASDRLIRCLGYQATLVVYGAMSLDLIKLNMAVVLSEDLTIRSFWVSSWYRIAPREEIRETFNYLTKLVASGKLFAKIGAVYSLNDYLEALEHADMEAKDGKILFVNKNAVN
ncbi:MAG: zinc-dependent alcohol dehydrogenase family protein [Candidatus Heimdallarchaeota archaeon]|nr:zinc-dependent alcohol dehydrogenase family protein [Candidatus Heimdallarchaeota archaeon]